MKRLLLALLFLGCSAVWTYAAQVRAITSTLTADGNFDVTEANAVGPVDAMTVYSDGVDGGGTLTFKACITSAAGSCRNILDVTGDGVTCDATACTCTAACTAQVKSSGTGPYRIYRMALSGSTAPTLALAALVYKE